MANFVPFNGFLAKAFAGSFNLTTDVLGMGLMAAAPAPGAGNVSELTLVDTSAAAGDLNLTTTAQGTVNTNEYRITVADKQVAASGADIGPFRYVVVYATASGELVSFYDLGDNVTIEDGVTMNFDFNQTTGLFTVNFTPA